MPFFGILSAILSLKLFYAIKSQKGKKSELLADIYLLFYAISEILIEDSKNVDACSKFLLELRITEILSVTIDKIKTKSYI